MGFTFEDLDGSQAADINQTLGQVTGYGFVEGGDPMEGARPFAVDILDATTYVDGEKVTTDAVSIDFTEVAVTDRAIFPLSLQDAVEEQDTVDLTDIEQPRKAIIFIGPDGGVHVAAGKAERPRPADRLRFQTYQPSPPDFADVRGVPVCEVWIGANSQHITDEDIRDRRLNADIQTHSTTGETISFDRWIDASNLEKEEMLDQADVNTDEVIQGVINDDADHGITASHEYYSGSHDDLSHVATDSHHARYADSEAQSAVEGAVELDALVAGESTTPGTHLEKGDFSPQWGSPPMAEAPVLQTGTMTHTGGSSTSVTISDIAPTPKPQFELGIAVGVDASPSWAADYAYSVDTSYRWDDANQMLEADVTMTWDTDPGSGNDLTLSYAVYEMRPGLVNDIYDDADVRAALEDRHLSPPGMSLSKLLGLAVYNSPSDHTGAVLGDIISATDPDTGKYGEFVYDGTEWQGPYGAGVSSLSDLTIDVSKDWAGYPIQNVETTADSLSLLALGDIETHTAVADAHHTKTLSEDIDHGLVANVQSDQHHTRYGDAEAVSAAALQEVSTGVGATTIEDGEEARSHAVVDDGETLALMRVMLITGEGTAPSGTALRLTNLETGENYYTLWSSLYEEASPGNPLVEIDGPASLAIRVINNSGKTFALGGKADYWLDRSGVS